MKRLAFVLIATVALMCAAFVSGAGAHKFSAASTVSVKFDKPKPNDPYATGKFDGNVRSTKTRCQKRRTVTLNQRTATGSTVIGTDVTDANGEWLISSSSTVAPGTYFAQVSKRVIRKNTKHRHVCKAAVSKDVAVK